MKIEFTKDELDYLACKIAEILRHRIDVNVGTSDDKGSALAMADTPLSEIKMSTKLRNVLRSYDLQDWTPRDVAYYKGLEWARLRGLGRKSHNELRDILRSAGLDFGYHYFRRGENIRTIIIEKPMAQSSREHTRVGNKVIEGGEVMRKFEIWVEGFCTMGADSKAWKEGEQEAETFEEACDLYAERHPSFKQNYRKQDGKPIWWGCRLFDNEADARKSFG